MPKEVVAALVDLHRQDVRVARILLANWLNIVLEHQQETGSAGSELVFDDRVMRFLLAQEDLFRFKIGMPTEYIAWAIPRIYELGGALGRGDLRLFLSAFVEDSLRYRRLDRQSKEIVRRLQSETPNQLRLY